MKALTQQAEWEDEKYYYSRYRGHWRHLTIEYTIVVDLATLSANLLIDDDFAYQFSGLTAKRLLEKDEMLDFMNLFLSEMGSYPIIDRRTPSLCKF